MNGKSMLLDRSPGLFPYGIDMANDTVSFVRLSQRDFESASFLDTRIMTPAGIAHTVPWKTVATFVNTAGLPERCGYIFHIGHVGSTLLSRLIGAHPRAFVLREPMVLRTFAGPYDGKSNDKRTVADSRQDLLGGTLRLLSRTFEPQQNAIVKTTSFVSEIAAALLTRNSAPKAVMVYVEPESYLATILGGPNSRQEAKMLLPGRLNRLHHRIGRITWQASRLSEGEVLALGWATEMCGLVGAARIGGARVQRVDFDRFLLDPAAILHSVLEHFELKPTEHETSALLRGAYMRQYSKAPEHAYDASLRAEVLNDARAVHGAEIRRGLAWLDRAARTYPALHDALAFCTRV